MLGSLELLTIRPPPDEGEGGDLLPLTAALEPSPAARGSGDKSRSDSGEEAYDRRDVIGKRKSSERYSSNWKAGKRTERKKNKSTRRSQSGKTIQTRRHIADRERRRAVKRKAKLFFRLTENSDGLTRTTERSDIKTGGMLFAVCYYGRRGFYKKWLNSDSSWMTDNGRRATLRGT